jgi:hypothetical protein
VKDISATIEVELQFAPCDVVIQSLEPDNVLPSGPLQIVLSGKEKTLYIEINGCERIETLITTVEDIFQAIQVVEKTAQTKIHQN